MRVVTVPMTILIVALCFHVVYTSDMNPVFIPVIGVKHAMLSEYMSTLR
jgi:hypothetical protein